MSTESELGDINPEFFSFESLCATLFKLSKKSTNEDFPLITACTFRSNVGTRFTNLDFEFSSFQKTKSINMLPLIKMNMLTLAGPDGALPWWVAEKIQYELYSGGSELHVFLDLLNRRFWEILFMSSGSGNRRHIRYARKEHYEVMDELSFGLCSTPRPFTIINDVESVEAIQIMRTNGYAQHSKSPSGEEMVTMLEILCKKRFSIKKNQMIRLPIGERAKIRIGKDSKTSRISRYGSVLGNRALTYSGMIIEVFLNSASELQDLMLLNESKCIKNINTILSIFYGQVTPHLILRVNTFRMAAMSCLGSSSCVLGWGASTNLNNEASFIFSVIDPNKNQ